MDVLQAALGSALIILVFVDLVQTTLAVNGHGLMSGPLSAGVWRALLGLHRLKRSQGLLCAGGPAIIVLFYVVWFGLLWAGWTLVFASADDSVLQGMTKQPADAGELLYFVGFTIITLGVGDYVPQGDLWQVLTVVASASGFFLVTMIITYVLPVLSAVVHARQLASSIHGLGRSPDQLLQRAWNGRDYSALDSPLQTLTQQIRQLEKQHLAYPVLHYFQSRTRKSNLALAVSSLDDFLSLLLSLAPAEQRPAEAVLGPARDAVDDLLTTLRENFIKPADETPPPPTLPLTGAAGQREVGDAFEPLAQRRRLLLGWVADSGRSWRAED